jgi:hypothetical protein
MGYAQSFPPKKDDKPIRGLMYIKPQADILIMLLSEGNLQFINNTRDDVE